MDPTPVGTEHANANDANLSNEPVSQAAALRTERLALRPFRPSDASDVFAYSRDPRVGHDAGWEPHRSIDDSLAFITEVAPHGHVWAIVDPTADDEHPEGRVIGSIGLIADPARPHDRALMLGYALGVDWWSRGYMTEVSRCVIAHGFEDLGLDLITCTCYPWNTASRHVIEKCGFAFEGVRRGAEVTYDGRLEDARCHSLTRKEWERQKAERA